MTTVKEGTNTVSQAGLSVRDLRIDAGSRSGSVPIVQGVSFDLAPGRILGLIGESGSGKSMIAKSILGMLPAGVFVREGSIRYAGRSLLALTDREWREIRGASIGAIFQDPLSSLNPVLKIEEQIVEALQAHGATGDLRQRAQELLGHVGIPDPAVRLTQYPHEFSGGMRQRVCIAMAIANRPSLLIADEPTTAVDMTVQARILATLKDLQAEMGLSILMITHDMGLVSRFCDDLVVMRKGNVVETGTTAQIMEDPQQDYTKALIAAVPKLEHAAPVLSQSAHQSVMRAEAIVTRVGPPGLPWRPDRRPPAVDGVSFQVGAGETLGLVGESGCGKTTLARTVAGFLKSSQGSITVGQSDIFRSVQYVFQDPFASLNPRLTIRDSLDEAFSFSNVAPGDRAARARDLMHAVGLEEDMLDRLPGAFSGGQRQRIVIARALAASPEVIVCDEAVSALDVSVQARVLELLRDVQERTDVGILFISHDLAVVKTVSHRTAVMYLGKIVEIGPTGAIFDETLHPYTTSLLASVSTHPWNNRPEVVLLGETPRPGRAPSGCRFHDRCPIGPRARGDRQECISTEPELRDAGGGHYCACHHAGELRAQLQRQAAH